MLYYLQGILYPEGRKIHFQWKSIIVGEGEDLDYIKGYIIKKGIRNIEAIGHCDDVQFLYRKTKMVVATSF